MPEGKSWNETDRGPYIRVHSGKVVYLADPQPEDFNVDDVAFHLAGINRYTGGSRFTVAQHCVVAAEMARKFYPTATCLPSLMLIHDADEAFYGDVSSPLKSLLSEYKVLEQRAQLAVEKRFDCMFIGDSLVEEVDYRMWLSERQYLKSSLGGPASNDYSGSLIPFPLDEFDVEDYFTEWPSDVAEFEWKRAYGELFRWLQ